MPLMPDVPMRAVPLLTDTLMKRAKSFAPGTGLPSVVAQPSQLFRPQFALAFVRHPIGPENSAIAEHASFPWRLCDVCHARARRRIGPHEVDQT